LFNAGIAESPNLFALSVRDLPHLPAVKVERIGAVQELRYFTARAGFELL
jgi:hypothetical protein